MASIGPSGELLCLYHTHNFDGTYALEHFTTFVRQLCHLSSTCFDSFFMFNRGYFEVGHKGSCGKLLCL